MKIGEIFALALEMGTAADPRGREGVAHALGRIKKHYDELPPRAKADFDTELLENPYADTALLYGEPSRPVRRVMAGIDIDPAEIMVADRLRERGTPIDLVIAHHPQGKGLAALDAVMYLQADLLHLHGVPINVAEKILKPRIAQVERGISPINHNQSVDVAQLMDVPLMCLHTVADNCAYQFMQRHLDEKQPETVGEIIEAIKEIPEYAQAAKHRAGPKIFVGSPEARAGKIAVTEFTGGTEGAKEIYARLSAAGVGTIVGMHMKEESREEAEKNHLNVVIAGHMSSDSLGMNQILDKLSEQGIEIVPISGLIRVDRHARSMAASGPASPAGRPLTPPVEPPLPQEPPKAVEEF